MVDKNSVDQSVIARFVAAFRSLGITRATLANLVGMTGAGVMYYVDGKRVPPVALIVALEAEYGVNSHWILTGEGEMMGRFEKVIPATRKKEIAQTEAKDATIREYLESQFVAAKGEAERLRRELEALQSSGSSFSLAVGGETLTIPADVDLKAMEKVALDCALRVIRQVSEKAPAGKAMPPKKAAEITVRAYRVCLEGQMKQQSQQEIMAELNRIA